MKYNPQIHQRRSIRLPGYDYSQNGAYFITICTRNKECLFGEVVNYKMVQNAAGQIVQNEWLNTAKIRPHISLDAFVVMPNHIHGIIVISRGELHSPSRIPDQINWPGNPESSLSDPDKLINNNDAARNSDAGNNSKQGECNSPLHLKSPKDTVGAIIRGFKAAVTRQLKSEFGESVWQRNYYEHIIRNEESYQNIAEYIENNPANWDRDRFYSA